MTASKATNARRNAAPRLYLLVFILAAVSLLVVALGQTERVAPSQTAALQLVQDLPRASASTTLSLRHECDPYITDKTKCKLVRIGSSFAGNRELIRSYLDEFIQVYASRPERDNFCGVRFNHAMAIYVTIKELKPAVIIESGVNSGVSTWFMRQASGNSTKIISIDPEDKPICSQPVRWLDEVNQERYLGKEKFVDFTEIDWDAKIANGELQPNTTLVYIDDHLPFFPRVATFLKYGFTHVILEDNYKLGSGATRGDKWATPKQMFMGGWKSKTNADDAAWLLQHLDSYHEFPPLLPISLVPTQRLHRKQGGFLYHDDDPAQLEKSLIDPATEPQFVKDLAQTLGIDPKYNDSFSYSDLFHYNHIAYMKFQKLSPYLRAYVQTKPEGNTKK